MKHAPRWPYGLMLFAIAVMSFLPAKAATAAEPAGEAEAVLNLAGVRGGLVVHIGCGDGRLTGALHASDSFLVHGLDADPEDIRAARQYLRQARLYGPVTVEQWSSATLPYADEIANMIVAEDLPATLRAEVERVLAPGGVAVIKTHGQWEKTVKAWPSDIDQWSHFLHDASNNAVARDSRVGPPRRLRWHCGPLWSRSHEFNSSLSAMVSAGGRLFYVEDEGLLSLTEPPIPERWTLVARDAFNGVLLWKRPLPHWGSAVWRNRALRSIPAFAQKSLVANGDQVFIALEYGGPVSILDAATGQLQATLDETDHSQELRFTNGVLLVKQADGLRAFDVDSHQLLWNVQARIVAHSLAASEDRVVYQDRDGIQCVSLKDGRAVWRAECPANVALMVIDRDLVLAKTNSQLLAITLDAGQRIWTANTRGRQELFVAQDRAWSWEGNEIVGRDLATGEVVERPDVSEVFTRGHHLRCYQSKATADYMITPNRGVEFVNLAGGPSSEHDWTRGACTYGVVPANGLLYVPPNPCFCYPGVKVTGYNAFAAGASQSLTGAASAPRDRLIRGPAFGTKAWPSSASKPSPEDWPTYRQNNRRTGSSPVKIAGELDQQWEARLTGSLTPPIVAGGRVLVAEKDTNTLHAFGLADGLPLWQFVADGRIDSPPTVYGDLVLFGGADGRVYCLRAEDGELVWRFQAAPSTERIISCGRLESPWRVHGSVLVEQGVAYFTAGRSSYLDGGIWVYGLDPDTGRVKCQTRLDDWSPHRQDSEGKPFVAGYHMEGAKSDILVAQNGFLYLGQLKFDRALRRLDAPYILAPEDKTEALDIRNAPYTVPDQNPDQDYEKHQRDWIERTQANYVAELRAKFGGYSLGQRELGLHVFSPAGFLDDSWFNRTYWMYSATWPGYYLAHRAAKTGQLLVVGDERTYAVQAFPSRNLQSPLFTPGDKGYLLIADDNDNEPFLDYRTRETTKGWGYTRKRPPAWYQWMNIRIRAMVLADDQLIVAGPPDVVDPVDPMASFEGRLGGVLRVSSAADGAARTELKLKAPPVFDGLIAAQHRLVMSTTDSRLICLGAVDPPPPIR